MKSTGVLLQAVSAMLVIFCAACGGSSVDQPVQKDVFSDEDNKTILSFAGGVASIYVTLEEEGFSYCIDGNFYSEVQLFDWIGQVSRDFPHSKIDILPCAEMSKDQVNLLSAKIRAKGISDVRVVNR